MTVSEQNPDERRPDDVVRLWRSLTAAARQAPQEPPPGAPSDLAERVLAQHRARADLPMIGAGDERIFSWGAVLALAASILLLVSSWGSISAVVAPRPALFDDLIALEPLP